MGAISLVARREMQRRWASLAGLALIVAIVSAAITTAFVGAQRASSSVERFRDWADASDLSFQASDQDHADEMLDAALGLPDAAAVAERRIVNAFLVDNPLSDIAIQTDPAGRWSVDIDRPLLLAGRAPDPDQPDEIVLNELAADETGLRVGDHVTANTWTAQDLEALFDDAGFPGFHGPVLDLEVVGIGRFLDDLAAEVQRTAPYAWAPASFLTAHPEIGVWPGAVYVRLADDDGALERVTSVLGPLQQPADLADPAATGAGGTYNPASTAEDDYLRVARDAGNSLAAALVIFAISVLVLGGVVVGQATMRVLLASSDTADTLFQLGLSRRRTAAALTLPVAAAGSAGVVVGAAIAVALSPLLPVGVARSAEIDPGVRIAFPITLAVAGFVVVVLVAFAFSEARWSPRRRDTVRHPSPAVFAGLSRYGSLPPAVATGVQLVVDPGRGSRRLPIRSGVTALVIGLAAVSAASVVGASSRGLEHHPAWWGWNWSSVPDAFSEQDTTTLMSQLASDERVDGVGVLEVGTVLAGGEPLSAYAIDSLSGDVSFTVDRGRLPHSPTETALGEQTASDLGVGVGENVDVRGEDGSSRRFTIVGTVVFPYDEQQTLDEGIAFTPDGLSDFLYEPPSRSILLRYAPGLDANLVEAALSDDYELAFNKFSVPHPPASVRNLSFTADVASTLGLFFAVLAVITLVHTLFVSTSRRRGDLAILRALGFERGQIRWAVIVQSLVLASLAVVIGIPAGLVIGRFVWRHAASGTGAIAPALTPVWFVVALVPVAVLVAVLAAWWPGRVAARHNEARWLTPE